ncbi:hypothetical protein GCM10023333_40820 [Ferrimonas pelagia]|uniref:Uncharacterized protein n=1 Tax=Ferrimonas pelagia TaxID=1177826 RepID=A0ABP9FK28_9GAMM
MSYRNAGQDVVRSDGAAHGDETPPRGNPTARRVIVNLSLADTLMLPALSP